MSKLIAIDAKILKAEPYELEVLADAELNFLPPVTMQVSGGEAKVLYSCEGLLPLSHFGARTGVCLNDFFVLLSLYIHALLAARDALLNPMNIGSDPARSVLIREGAQREVRLLYVPDEAKTEAEKIFRIAAFFASKEEIMGAKGAFERFSNRFYEMGAGLKDALKLCEAVQREWNYI